MNKIGSVAAKTDGAPPEPLTRSLYRYFFYGWLFSDADGGSALERSTALRDNRERARWLPVYMRRWGFIGLVVYFLGRWSEAQWPGSLWAGVFAILMTVVVVNLVVTGVCWAFLRWGRRD